MGRRRAAGWRLAISAWLLGAAMVAAPGSARPERFFAGRGRVTHPSATEPLAIVVNRSNPVSNLSMRELREIFLNERSYWPSGRRITLVLRDAGDPEREAILHDVCGMTENEYKTHVLRGLYTGEILVSPKTLSTAAGVRRFIFYVPGAIGGLRVGDVDGTVRVVRIDNLLPGDKGYALHVEPAAGQGGE